MPSSARCKFLESHNCSKLSGFPYMRVCFSNIPAIFFNFVDGNENCDDMAMCYESEDDDCMLEMIENGGPG